MNRVLIMTLLAMLLIACSTDVDEMNNSNHKSSLYGEENHILLSTDQKLLIEKGDGQISIEISGVEYENNSEAIFEACTFTITAGDIVENIYSQIEYKKVSASSDSNPDGSVLEKMSGDRNIVLPFLNFSWSNHNDRSVYIYLKLNNDESFVVSDIGSK
jgi:hypothetical protein